MEKEKAAKISICLGITGLILYAFLVFWHYMAGVGYKYYFNSFFNNILLSAGWLIMAGTMFVFGWLLPLVGLILGVKGFKKQPNSNYIAQIGIFLAILEIYFYWLFFF